MPVYDFRTMEEIEQMIADPNLPDHLKPQRADIKQVTGYGETASRYYIFQTWKGLCIADRERNMHDDSDFFMTVWDPIKGKSKEIMFATTRGWSYPAYGSSPDATPEIRALYEEEQSRKREEYKIAKRNQQLKLASEMNLSIEAFDRLYSIYQFKPDTWERVKKILTSKLRSGFKISLAAQIRTWAETENPAHRTPLSPKQLEYL